MSVAIAKKFKTFLSINQWQVSRINAVCCAGHLTISRGMVVGATADAGACFSGKKRWNYLRDGADFYLYT